MKFINLIACTLVLFVACEQPKDNAANEAFEKNSKTVMAYLEGFQNENLDYAALYADNALLRGTGYNEPDSIDLAGIMEGNKKGWAMLDFELVTDPVVLLPGVNVETKMADGSVRYYGTWKVTVPATDSTEARSGMVKLYESFDFDKDGKIVYQQYYGDTSGLWKALMDDGSSKEMTESEDEASSDEM